MNISVAALMTTRWIARRVTAPPGVDNIVIPGLCEGDVDTLQQATGLPVRKGPADVRALPEWYGREAVRAQLGPRDVRVFAEINGVQSLSREQVIDRAQAYRTGAPAARGGPPSGRGRRGRQKMKLQKLRAAAVRGQGNGAGPGRRLRRRARRVVRMASLRSASMGPVGPSGHPAPPPGTDARRNGPMDAAEGGPCYFENTNLPIGPSSGLLSSGRHKIVSSILRASVKSLSVMPPAECVASLTQSFPQVTLRSA